MACQKILDIRPAGSGKTSTIIEAFVQELQSGQMGLTNASWFIVPTSEHAQRIHDVILRRKDVNGFFQLNVVTINSFVRHFAGFHLQQVVSDPVRRNLLSNILVNGKWKYLPMGPQIHDAVDVVGDLISELKNNGVNPHVFKKASAAIQKKEPAYGLKYQDLLEILQQYETRLTEMNRVDFDDQITQFIEAIHNKLWVPPQFNKIWFDGFFEFSPKQRQFIQILSQFSNEMTITLTGDQDRGALFQIVEQTRSDLEAIGFKVSRHSFQYERSKHLDLRFAERQVFAEHCQKPVAVESIQILESVGVSGEVEAIARHIYHLYQTDAYHWSDFCIVLRQIGEYESILRSVFQEFKIPIEVHERRFLKNSHAARALRLVLQVILNDGPREEVIRLLKLPQWKISAEELLVLEQLADEAGIVEGWDKWQTLTAKITHLSESFRRAWKLLTQWSELIDAKKTVPAWSHAMRDISRMMRLSLHMTSMTDDSAKEDAHSLRRLDEVIREIEWNFQSQDKTTLSLEQYTAFLENAIEIALYSVGERNGNRVQVYDISSARQKEYKIVFVGGLLEKVFPREIRQNALIKDDERAQLNNSQFVLQEKKPRTHIEKYLFYLAITRATEQLYLSYPRYNFEGKEALPSFFVHELRKQFGDQIPIVQRRLQDIFPVPDQLIQKKEIYAWVIANLFQQQDTDRLLATVLYDMCRQEPDFQLILEHIRRSQREAVLDDPQILEILQKKEMTFSPTALELFAICPFRHFIQHTLRLDEKLDPTNVMNLGTALHDTLEDFYKETTVNKSKEEWLRFIESEEAKARIKQLVDVQMDKEHFQREKPFRKRLVTAALAETLIAFLDKEAQHEATRKTYPTHFEYKFGGSDQLKALPVGDTNIFLTGKIDRIDLCEPDKTAVVVDYKRSKSFKREEIEEGIHLQLPIYIMAVEALLGYTVIGAELYSLNKGERRGFYREDHVAHLGGLRYSRMKLSKEAFNQIIENTRQLIRQSVEDIQGGKIRVRSKTCDYCSCDAICRFEKWRLVYREHDDKKVATTEKQKV